MDLNKIIGFALGIGVLFLIASSLFFPQFETVYEHCTGAEPYPSDPSSTTYTNGCCNQATATITACSSCNDTAGYGNFLSTCHALIGTQNDTHCYKCGDFQEKNITQGLMLFILVIGCIAGAMAVKKYVW